MADFPIGAAASAVSLATRPISFIDNKLGQAADARKNLDKANDYLEVIRAYLNVEQIDYCGKPDQFHVKELQKIVHNIEDAIDKYMYRISQSLHSNIFTESVHAVVNSPRVLIAKSKFSNEIKEVIDSGVTFIAQLRPLVNSDTDGGRPSTRSRLGNDLPWNHRDAVAEEEIEGFTESKARLHKFLTEVNSEQESTISIVGPIGSGKSALANIAYQRDQGSFDFYAWVYVACKLEVHDLLQKLLQHFEAQTRPAQPNAHRRGEIQVSEKLRLLLQRKSFLVVLDDVWDKQKLRLILDALPKGSPGKRVIITTRNSDIARFPTKEVLDLSKGLTKEMANNLFLKKAFPGSGRCPDDLQKCSTESAIYCEGLPLAISLVANYFLEKRPATASEWQRSHDSLGDEMMNERSELSILSRKFEPSYRDLISSELRSCFTYFSMFPPGDRIPLKRILHLWAAEGLVKRGLYGVPTLEELAKEELMRPLIQGNLVYAESTEINGRVRSTCRVLKLHRDIIISKVKNVITVLQPTCSLPGEEIRHLSVQDVDMSKLQKSKLKYLRTLLVFGEKCSLSEIEGVLRRCKYLRVLDLRGVPNLNNFPKYVVTLKLLRYLSLRDTQVEVVPESIKDLVWLETLDLKHTGVTSLPEEIYQLHNLRHLLVCGKEVNNYVTSFGAARGVEVVSSGKVKDLFHKKRSIGDLASMEQLSLIKVNKKTELIRALGKLIRLRKLRLVDLESGDGRELCASIEKMENLSTFDVTSTSLEEDLDLDHLQSPPCDLQRVYLKGRLQRLPQWISKLSCLSKIGLKWSKLDDQHCTPFDALEALPHLMELELVNYYTGDSLAFRTATFKQLMVLSVEQFEDLSSLVIENGAMPKLKKLTMSTCQDLKELPVGVEGLICLDQLLLHDMPDEFIAKLQHASEYRHVVQHIRVIDSFKLGRLHSSAGFLTHY